MPKQFFFHLLQGHFIPQFPGKRSNFHIILLYTTGNDIVKVLECSIDIESKTMHGYPAAKMYTDGTDFARAASILIAQPNASIPLDPNRIYAVFG